MPFVQSQNPWIQAAGLTAQASDDLGNLMVNLPQQRQQMDARALQMQQERQQMALQQQQANAAAQLAPLNRQLMQGKIGLQQQQGDMLSQRGNLYNQQANLAQQKQQQAQQQLQAIAQLLQNNPNGAQMLYAKQPEYRQGGGMTYNAFTGQPTAQGPQKLNPGQTLIGGVSFGSTNAPTIAESPFAPKQTNPNGPMNTTIMNHLGSQGFSPEAVSNLVSQLPAINALLNGIGQQQPQQGMQRPIRSGQNNQITQPQAAPTNGVTKRWSMDANGNLIQQ